MVGTVEANPVRSIATPIHHWGRDPDANLASAAEPGRRDGILSYHEGGRRSRRLADTAFFSLSIERRAESGLQVSGPWA